MNIENIQAILAKALPGHVITESFCQWHDDDEGKDIFCHEISINRRGYEHRYVVIKLHASAPSREQAWKEAIERIKSASLTREEHAAVDRALAEITK